MYTLIYLIKVQLQIKKNLFFNKKYALIWISIFVIILPLLFISLSSGILVGVVSYYKNHILQDIQYLLCLRWLLPNIDLQFLSFIEQRTLAGKFRDKDPSPIAHKLRLEVFIRGGILQHRVHVYPSLMRESALAHERLVILMFHIAYLGNVPGDFRQIF